MTRPTTRTIAGLCCCLIIVLCTACGGGGGSGSEPVGGGTGSPPPEPPPPPPPPPENLPPIINGSGELELRLVADHPVDVDLIKGGTLFTDPDGDVLTYTVDFGPSESGVTWNQLAVSGTHLVGTAPQPGFGWAQVWADDGRGFESLVSYQVFIDPNSAPIVATPNGDVILGVGDQIDHDFTGGDTVFSDPDGDVLAYEAVLHPLPRGLSIDGRRVTGRIDSLGVVFVTVKAFDSYGGSVEDTFAVAAPALETRTPALPAIPFVYDDFELPLPDVFRRARENFGPLWDTTTLVTNPTTNAGAALGRVLFYDKRLSITNTVACASCHLREHGFAAPERFGQGVEGALTKRNVLGLTNVRYNLQNLYFWDMRAEGLEQLALMPIESQTELGSSLSHLEEKLTATEFYPPLFRAAFGSPEINRERISRALAQFLRSLISFQSRFDRAYHVMDGDDEPHPEQVLTEQELRGADIFFNSAHCSSCHARGVQVIELPANNGLDAVPVDPGLGDGQFRAASLRNVAVTAPYMHDGRFATLRDVIEHYSSGAVDSPLVDIRMRRMNTNNPVTLNLSEEDKDALEAFLHTLTDHGFLVDPKFSDPFQ